MIFHGAVMSITEEFQSAFIERQYVVTPAE